MATITSAQSGNFSSTSTWTGGVVPGNGDRFDVSSGHTVTLDSSTPIPSTGFVDSYIYGTLQSQASASMTLRMNGRLYVKGNGLLHLRDGATIQINGSSGEQHGIWVENENGASFIFEGSDGMPSTTLSTAENEGSTSLAVASGTNFAAGEWIAVFDNVTNVTSDTNDHTSQHQDEGFWIHEVSGNTIYFRIFGGPNDVTVSGASGSTLTVSNAKVFREGQKIIFGTGSNRNIKTISSVDYSQNKLTCDSSISGTVTGETVYLTGTEKKHNNTSKVRKVATVTTAAANNSATLTVANANMFTAGDEIWIEHRSEAEGTTDYIGYYDHNSYQYANRYKHTISSVSSNTITLTSATGYNVVEGALVTRMTRNIVIETVATDGSDYGFFYAEKQSDYNRKGIIKDVYFKNIGNDDSNSYQGFVIRGYWSTDALSVTLTEQIPARPREPWIEGVVVHVYPENTHRRDWAAIWLYDCRYAKARCCMTMHGDEGIGANYEPGQSVVNCIAVAAREWGFRLEGSTEWYEHAYNYSSRNRYGYRFLNLYEHGLGHHDLIADAHIYSFYAYNGNTGAYLYRCRFTGHRYGFHGENGDVGMVYSYIKALSGYVRPEEGTGTTQAGSGWKGNGWRYSGDRHYLSIEHNYEYDAMRMYGYNSESVWDNTEKAWRFYRRNNNSNNPIIGDRVFIPANVTVRVSAKVKMSSSFSGTRPYLTAFDMISATGQNRIGNAGGDDSSQWAGKRFSTQYTSASDSAYEEKQLTITSKPYPRNYIIGVYSSSSDATEGYFVKDMRINIDTPYANQQFNLVNNFTHMNVVPTRIRSSFTQQKKRLGGRLF